MCKVDVNYRPSVGLSMPDEYPPGKVGVMMTFAFTTRYSFATGTSVGQQIHSGFLNLPASKDQLSIDTRG